MPFHNNPIPTVQQSNRLFGILIAFLQIFVIN